MLNSSTFDLADLLQEADGLTAEIEQLQQRRDALRIVIELFHANDTATTVEADDTPAPVPDPPWMPPGMPGLPPGQIPTRLPPESLEAAPKRPPPGMPGVDPPRMPGLMPQAVAKHRLATRLGLSAAEMECIADPWDLPVNLAGAYDILERLRRIGRAAGDELLSTVLISQYLEDARVSLTSPKHLRRAVRSCIVDHPEHFEPIRSGVYRYHDTPRTRQVTADADYDYAADLAGDPPH